jgi:uncharacterized protein (TIGR03435 family)
MLNTLRRLGVCLAFTAVAALAQPKLAFEVASVKVAAPLDMVKVAQQVQAGEMPKMGAHVDGARAEYTYMSLKELIITAYKVKPYQVTGPDWMNTARFDIVAKLPEGTTKKDAPLMLQSLLEERFKLVTHHDKKENPVLGLVVAKGGAKMKESTEPPKAIDESVPLKKGEMSVDGPDGPVHVSVGANGDSYVNMGEKGSMHYKMNPQTMTMHMEGQQLKMDGFAEMLTQFSQITGAGGKLIMDMTDLKGYYEVTIDFSLADLMAMVRASGMEIPAGANLPGAGSTASDPSGASSIYAAVQALGLKLEQRRAMTDQLVVDHIEKTPIEN